MDGTIQAGNSFKKFPPELLDNVFAFVDPLDLLSIALTCKKFHTRTVRNNVLFRRLYLQLLDIPQDIGPVKKNWSRFDWEDEVHKFVLLRRVLTGESFDTVEKKRLRSNPERLYNFIYELVRTADSDPDESLNIKFLTEHFKGNLANIEAFCCQSVNYIRTRKAADPNWVSPSPEERQLSAKLHVYLGDATRTLPRATHARVYPYATSMCYDLRNYTSQTLWGPFKADGNASVDWEKMEAIMIVLGENARGFRVNEDGVLRPLWNYFWDGSTQNSYVSRKLEGGELVTPDIDFEDPYGISGTWMRIVCFLDFHELFHYNFSAPTLPAHVPRPPLNTVEAVRLIMMELRVTHQTPPGPEDGQNYPVVHFTGTAHSLHASWDPNANSNIRGTVRETKEGEIRWTSISVFNGEERWQSEAIQVGGLKSARGVLGHWFDKDWDPHGPAGPTAFWKISDEIADKSAIKPQDPQMVEAGEEIDEGEDVDEEDALEEEEEEEEVDEGGEEEELDLMVHFPNGAISFVHGAVGGDDRGEDGDENGGGSIGQGGVGYSVFVTFGQAGNIGHAGGNDGNNGHGSGEGSAN